MSETPDRSHRDEPDPTDWESRLPLTEFEGTGDMKGNAIQFSWWNLLLLVPLVMLFTPLYNKTEPVLFGLPFFYWAQLVFVVVGVVAVFIVFRATRDRRRRPENPPGSQQPPSQQGRHAGGAR